MPAYTSFVVAGAGNLGGAIANALLKQGFKTTVLTRSSSSPKVQSLAAAGATLREVDYEDGSSIAKAIAGAQVVINTLSAEALQTAAQDNLIAQLKPSNVQLYVPNDWGFDYDFSKKSGVDVHPFLYGKVALGAQLEKTGLPYLHIFTGPFGSFLGSLFSVDKEARTAKVAGAGNTTFASTAEKDVGDFIAKAFATLPRNELENASLRVSSSTRYIANELFAQVEKRDGKSWKVEHTDIAETKAAAFNPSLGMPSFFSWIKYAIEQGAANHPDDNARVGFESSVDLVDLVLGKKSA